MFNQLATHPTIQTVVNQSLPHSSRDSNISANQHLSPTVNFPSPHSHSPAHRNVNASVFSPIQGGPNVVGSTRQVENMQTQSPPTLLGTQSSGGGAAVVPVPPLAATPLDTLSVALLAQQLPSLPNLSGENIDGDGGSFNDWIERLELVANVSRWDDQTKLVNVATRLWGSASRYYRSCTPQQWSSYSLLTSAVRNRFTPVSIQSVQSSLFHERKQGPKEMEDNYAQELRKLFLRAYSTVQQDGGAAEAMGQSVLAYHRCRPNRSSESETGRSCWDLRRVACQSTL